MPDIAICLPNGGDVEVNLQRFSQLRICYVRPLQSLGEEVSVDQDLLLLLLGGVDLIQIVEQAIFELLYGRYLHA
jgi:hypothetical protein